MPTHLVRTSLGFKMQIRRNRISGLNPSLKLDGFDYPRCATAFEGLRPSLLPTWKSPDLPIFLRVWRERRAVSILAAVLSEKSKTSSRSVGVRRPVAAPRGPVSCNHCGAWESLQLCIYMTLTRGQSQARSMEDALIEIILSLLRRMQTYRDILK